MIHYELQVVTKYLINIISHSNKESNNQTHNWWRQLVIVPINQCAMVWNILLKLGAQNTLSWKRVHNIEKPKEWELLGNFPSFSRKLKLNDYFLMFAKILYREEYFLSFYGIFHPIWSHDLANTSIWANWISVAVADMPYVDAKISVLAKTSDWKIYWYQYWLRPLTEYCI